MPDVEKTPGGGKANASWTDKERLVYLIALLENNGTKLDFKNTPRPNGRSEIACQRMIDRLKTSHKTELEALKGGQSFPSEATHKKSGRKPKAAAGDGETATSPTKRKGKGEDGEATPKKRGRKVKSEAIVKDEGEHASEEVKAEGNGEDVDMET